MRVPPFYSSMRGIALVEAWHDHSDCPIGQSIALSDRNTTKDANCARCSYCAMLDHKPPRKNTAN